MVCSAFSEMAHDIRNVHCPSSPLQKFEFATNMFCAFESSPLGEGCINYCSLPLCFAHQITTVSYHENCKRPQQWLPPPLFPKLHSTQICAFAWACGGVELLGALHTSCICSFQNKKVHVTLTWRGSKLWCVLSKTWLERRVTETSVLRVV